MKTATRLVALVCLLAACGADATSSRDALGRYVAIGASMTAGFASDGLVYDGQSSAYPAQLARAAGVSFDEARVRAPGCVPPLVAPLHLDRTLSGRRAFTAPRDTTCNGRFADSVFAQNVAVPEMTTYQALRFTPDSAARPSDPRTRRAMEQILLEGYSQAGQAGLAGASLVSVELGFAELARALRSGRMVAATHETYRADTGFTYVPLGVWQPVYDSLLAVLGDSARIRRGVLLGLPTVQSIPALRTNAELHAARDSLRMFGVSLSTDCANSETVVHLAKVAAAAATATRTGATQTVSCLDVPGAADSVLTLADMGVLAALRDAMDGHVRTAATAREWAFAPVGVGGTLDPYVPRTHLTSPAPFGALLSLDGIHPSAAGQRVVAQQVAEALRTRYGLALSSLPPPDPVATR